MVLTMYHVQIHFLSMSYVRIIMNMVCDCVYKLGVHTWSCVVSFPIFPVHVKKNFLFIPLSLSLLLSSSSFFLFFVYAQKKIFLVNDIVLSLFFLLLQTLIEETPQENMGLEPSHQTSWTRTPYCSQGPTWHAPWAAAAARGPPRSPSSLTSQAPMRCPAGTQIPTEGPAMDSTQQGERPIVCPTQAGHWASGILLRSLRPTGR